MTRTEQAIARHGIAHLFAEVANPSGLIKAMQGHWHRDMHFVRELERFGRVAIVSPNRWLRVLARVESALLPGNEYRVFAPGGRTEALDWVMHGEPRNQEALSQVLDIATYQLEPMSVESAFELRIPVSAGQVEQAISTALARNGCSDRIELTVKIDGQHVRLGGRVSHWRERDIAHRAALAAKGVREVENSIIVG